MGTTMRGETLNQHANFETFGQAFLSWTIMSTGVMWEGLLFDCLPPTDGCVESQTWAELVRDGPRGCGTYAAYPIFISYQLLVAMVVMNLFVGVVLETFESTRASEAQEELKE